MPHRHDHLATAARRKSDDTLKRARAAVLALHKAGADITFVAVAQRAGVSRQWLYTNPAMRAEIEKLRGHRSASQGVPAAQRASDASLRQRNVHLREENKALRREVAELKEELAQLHGERRVIELGPRSDKRRRSA